MIEKIKVKLDPGAYAPERAHSVDAGLDLRAMDEQIVPEETERGDGGFGSTGV